MMTLEDVARITHELNRAYCECIGETKQSWEDLTEQERQDVMMGVRLVYTDPNSTPESLHEAWWHQKKIFGWTYGPVKDTENKKHPCCVPYNELPEKDRVKDYLFRSVVSSLQKHTLYK